MSEPSKSVNLLRVEGIELVDIEDGGEKYARVSDLLAAGWLPPEEAEALRKAVDFWKTAAYDERVEEIDCPNCKDTITPGREEWGEICSACRGSAKLWRLGETT